MTSITYAGCEGQTEVQTKTLPEGDPLFVVTVNGGQIMLFKSLASQVIVILIVAGALLMAFNSLDAKPPAPAEPGPQPLPERLWY